MQEHIDHDMLRELRSILGHEYGALVSTFSADGLLRLAAMRSALAAADAGGLREAAHSLKGASLNFGAGPLAGMCRQLEVCARACDFAGSEPLVDAIDAELRLVSRLLADGPA